MRFVKARAEIAADQVEARASKRERTLIHTRQERLRRRQGAVLGGPVTRFTYCARDGRACAVLGTAQARAHQPQRPCRIATRAIVGAVAVDRRGKPTSERAPSAPPKWPMHLPMAIKRSMPVCTGTCPATRQVQIRTHQIQIRTRQVQIRTRPVQIRTRPVQIRCERIEQLSEHGHLRHRT